MVKKEAPTIKTERLTLRRLMESDIPFMSDMFADDQVTKYLTATHRRVIHILCYKLYEQEKNGVGHCS